MRKRLHIFQIDLLISQSIAVLSVPAAYSTVFAVLLFPSQIKFSLREFPETATIYRRFFSFNQDRAVSA
jgi:hypothetical protein